MIRRVCLVVFEPRVAGTVLSIMHRRIIRLSDGDRYVCLLLDVVVLLILCRACVRYLRYLSTQ